MLVNRFVEPADLESGRARTASVAVCLSLIALADFTLSSTISPLLCACPGGGPGGGTGVSLALADFERGFFLLSLPDSMFA